MHLLLLIQAPHFLCAACGRRMTLLHCESDGCTWLKCDGCRAVNAPLTGDWFIDPNEDG